MTYNPLEAPIEQYDIVQIRAKDGSWADFTTLRTASDIRVARRLVETGEWDGKVHQFRVVRAGSKQVIIGRED